MSKSALMKFLEVVANCTHLPEETQAELQDLLPEIEAEVEPQA